MTCHAFLEWADTLDARALGKLRAPQQKVLNNAVQLAYLNGVTTRQSGVKVDAQMMEGVLEHIQHDLANIVQDTRTLVAA
jgi:hypothetical protein